MKPTRSVRKYLAEIGRKGGRKGGLARQATLTHEQRRDLGRKAAQARWSNARRPDAIRTLHELRTGE